MDRLSEIFKKCAGENRAALVIFGTAGYPSLEESEQALEAAVRNGADILELGVPFSDPMADGPVISDASAHALENGVTPRDVLALAQRIRARHPATGLVLFSYMNTLLSIGYETLAGMLANAGVDAVLPVDLPLEERNELLEPCRAHGIFLIPLVSPLTPPERIGAIAEGMRGFLYSVNVAGVTGARKGLPAGFAEHLKVLKAHAHGVPIAAGFGIADRETAHEAALAADAVVAGSAFVRKCAESPDSAGAFVRELALGVRRGK